MRQRSRRFKGYVSIIGTIILWSWAVIFIKILSEYFDPVTQNFYRYSSAAFILLLACFFNNRSNRNMSIDNISPRILIPALLVFSYQMFTVYGIYLTTPTIASLIMRTNVIFINIMSFILFEEERRIIRRRNFLLGLVLAFIGVIGISLKGANYGKLISFDIGALMVLLGTIFWASYIISIKILLRRTEPLPLTAIVFSIASIIFLPTTLFLGEIDKVIKVTLSIDLLLIGSGILCVGIGNFINYIAIKELGAATTSSLQLMIPLFTGIFSYIVIGETLSQGELLFGGLLLLGCGIIIRETALHQ